MCGAHGSEVIGVRPETQRTLVQAPLQFLDVCCTLRQGTLPTLCQCNQLKLGISICWELMDCCFIQGAQLGMSTSLLGLHNLNKDLTVVLAECYKKLSQQQNLKPNCQQMNEASYLLVPSLTRMLYICDLQRVITPIEAASTPALSKTSIRNDTKSASFSLEKLPLESLLSCPLDTS